jgi:hypothetical protein
MKSKLLAIALLLLGSASFCFGCGGYDCSGNNSEVKQEKVKEEQAPVETKKTEKQTVAEKEDKSSEDDIDEKKFLEFAQALKGDEEDSTKVEEPKIAESIDKKA